MLPVGTIVDMTFNANLAFEPCPPAFQPIHVRRAIAQYTAHSQSFHTDTLKAVLRYIFPGWGLPLYLVLGWNIFNNYIYKNC